MSLDVEHHFHPQFPSTSSSKCDLHPNETFTGFCASCLRERLQGLEASAISNPSAGRKSTSALKSVFYKLSGSSANNASAQQPPQPPVVAQRPSFSELRRCKSFSFGRGPVVGAFEPQRRSCDVRTTLWSLFNQDDQLRRGNEVVEVVNDQEDEIRPDEPVVENCGEIEEEMTVNVCEIEEEEVRIGDVEMKAMKEHIVDGLKKKVNFNYLKAEREDMSFETQFEESTKKGDSKDSKEKAGSFWLAASVFSKKLQKWRRSYKVKKQSGSKAAAAAMPAPKVSKFSRQFGRDTQSEVASDVFGRRSCDTDPRFSLDAGRFSFDDPRFSWDEPRASWDGYLIGGRSVFPRLPPMLSVVEDAPVSVVHRSDGLIPVEEDVVALGGSLQTKDYYLDSSSRRRRSLDRSGSIREQAMEFCEQRPVFNGRVAPAGGAEHLHCYHGGFVDRDARDWSSNFLRDEYLGGFDNALDDPFKAGDRKKSRRWSKAWNILGFLQKRNSSRNANVVDRSFSESWTELQSRGFSGKMSRCNSSVSARNSFSGSTASMRSRSNTNGYNKKRTGEFVLERNRSARFSPNQNDNGMLRFYLAPMRNSRRNGISGNSQQLSSNYLSKSMLGLY